ncbi:PAS domain-containing sensor histidine kinase [uncultured Tateyamaria sp.]|uniref:PAS domain-containing sensor histidine kinase n=1 Tax=uncultured Tateyamaria sp. TaxID=455651 RepID=UPI002602B143|nr:PAS domain-containing sensor histidine kinase [uncultured Tateyamaria sp.]
MTAIDFSPYDFVDQPIFVLVAGKKGLPVYGFANQAVRDRLALTLDQIVGRPAYDLFTGRAAYSVFRRQCKAWEGGEATEYEIALPIGTHQTWVHTQLRPVHDADGQMTHMVGISRDITKDRARAAEQSMTVASAHEMQDLICMAAHDLRSPVGNLKSLADVMRIDFVDHGDGKAQLIDMIDALADQALEVISGIMLRAMAPDAQGHNRVFDLGGLCDDVLVLLDPQRTHSVSYERLLVDTDYAAVQIVLRNLIDNAFKHGPNTPRRVSVQVEEMNAQRLRFSVCDDGPGFSTAAITKGPGRGRDGTGFGLMGISKLARSHGGVVNIVPPHSGHGAEVHLELPGKIVRHSASIHAFG